MKRLRILALMHDYLVPPENASSKDAETADWKTEYDVSSALRGLGHEVLNLGIKDDLGVIKQAVSDFKPQIAFNLLENFREVSIFDSNVVSYLELLGLPYTGCNSRGLMLARDKSVSGSLLAYHRIPAPEFTVFRRGFAVRRPRRLTFPLIVKSLTEEASIGISQASIVDDDGKLAERVRFIHDTIGTDALVSRYIDGRELYVGVLGNVRLQMLPPWEMFFTKMPDDSHRIATARVKWSDDYRKKHGIDTGKATLEPAVADRITRLCRRVYRTLELSGYARIDLRLDHDGRVFVIEANPNPQIAQGEDLADSAKCAGISYEALLQRILELGRRWRPERAG